MRERKRGEGERGGREGEGGWERGRDRQIRENISTKRACKFMQASAKECT